MCTKHRVAFISVGNRHLALKNESDQCANTYLQSQLCSTKVTSIYSELLMCTNTSYGLHKCN